MRGRVLTMLAIAAMLSFSAACAEQPAPDQSQPTPQQPAPQPTPPKDPGAGKVVLVEIIADTLEGHGKRCAAAPDIPHTTVLAIQPAIPKDPGNNVRHCVGGKLIDHQQAHDEFPDTFVRVSAGQSVRWFSKATNFRVALKPHGQLAKGAPPYPFMEDLPKTFSSDVTSPAVLDVPGEVEQRYKVTFEIEKPGNIVDPDVICSM